MNNAILKKNRESDFNFYIIFFIIISLLGFIAGTDIRLSRIITIPVTITGVFLILIWGFTKPNFSILILTAYLPFSQSFMGKFDSEIIGLNLSNILLGIIVIGWIFYSKSHNEKLLTKAPLNKIIIIFCLVGLMAVIRTKLIYSNYYIMDNLFILFKRWITPICLYFIGLNMVKDKITFKRVVFVILMVTFIIALMATREYLIYGDRGSIESSRIKGVFGNPNILGAFLVYNMFFFLSFFSYNLKSLKHWLLLIPLFICLRGIMVTFSRGAYLAFAAGSFFTIFFRNKILILILIVFILFVILFPGLLPEGMRYRMASTFGGEKVVSTNVNDIKDKSAEIRVQVWEGGVKMISEQPIFGFGYGMFPYLIGFYSPGFEGTDAHNLYLTIATEMGIPALIIFFTILLIILIKALYLLKHLQDKYFKSFGLGMVGMIFGILIANYLGSRLLYSEELSSYFWLLSGLLMRALVMFKRKEIT